MFRDSVIFMERLEDSLSSSEIRNGRTILAIPYLVSVASAVGTGLISYALGERENIGLVSGLVAVAGYFAGVFGLTCLSLAVHAPAIGWSA